MEFCFYFLFCYDVFVCEFLHFVLPYDLAKLEQKVVVLSDCQNDKR